MLSYNCNFCNVNLKNNLLEKGLSETAVMDLMATNLQQQRCIVEQLKREASIKRLPVTEACSEIVKYVTEHEQEDCLLVGFSSQKVNPFREKSSCTVL
ncbi:Guanine nucleotide-binding protein subunit gamma-1, partial [Pseudolycoriella hygida]